MNKESYLAVTIITAVILVLSAYAVSIKIEPGWLPVIVVVLTFPVFVLALFLWWNASNVEGDIPFTGY
ncbi:MAG TPA: hypothetical protein PLG55_02090 [Methanospirillum sp.]|jgi:hypothetical protein|uniref:hypothetical protein n=1 Tax=Methanospirillum sp. TaxID=45200 RepID=UPI0009D12EB1|nr:hypothetical protein [Methanospirillum sp.]OQB38869.1 MAG: hypothetical protein BWY05_00246 [Euryarchaeota archaeon ADurb.Bin165]HPY59501.1 hypothetical protein [Methanospirillum sp.]